MFGKSLRRTIILILAVIVALIIMRRPHIGNAGTPEIEYRGEHIKLTRWYNDYGSYKDDTNNIDVSELPKIERMMTEAKIGPTFKDWPDFVHQEMLLSFPGYGGGGMQRLVSAGREFIIESVEIPRVEKDRIFVVEKLSNRSWRLVDDFISLSEPFSERVVEVRFIDGKLVYYNHEKRILRETKL